MQEMPMQPEAADVEVYSPAESLAEAGRLLAEVADGIDKDGQVPDEVKAMFKASLDAFMQGAQALMGGGEVADQQAPQPSTMEQGASGAQPMSMRRPG